jgi:hypothetical protein
VIRWIRNIRHGKWILLEVLRWIAPKENQHIGICQTQRIFWLGYVRLRAEDQGLELARDYYSASLASATSTWTPRGARKSRRGMTALDRARMNNPQAS